MYRGDTYSKETEKKKLAPVFLVDGVRKQTH